MSILKEFKDFAMKGNVVDMAVGVIIGAAFGKIVSSLVDDIIMPLIGVVTGGMNFTDLKWVVQKGITEGETVIQPEVTMNYGAWIQTVVDFLIVAFCIFVMIKFMNQLRRKKEEEPAPARPQSLLRKSCFLPRSAISSEISRKNNLPPGAAGCPRLSSPSPSLP